MRNSYLLISLRPIKSIYKKGEKLILLHDLDEEQINEVLASFQERIKKESENKNKLKWKKNLKI